MPATTKQILTAGNGYGPPVFIEPTNTSVPMVPTVKVIPGSGGTMSVQYTTSTVEDISAGTATWTLWPAGSVSVVTSDYLSGSAMAVQAEAVGANGTLEVCQ